VIRAAGPFHTEERVSMSSEKKKRWRLFQIGTGTLRLRFESSRTEQYNTSYQSSQVFP